MAEDARLNLIQQILRLEWPMFQAVNNAGGKADCQKNQEEFIANRSALYLVWNPDSLESLLGDLKTAVRENRNMVTEKYARMMEYSDPDYFNSALKPFLPVTAGETVFIARQITNQYLKWEKEFNQQFPMLAKRSRKLTNTAKGSEAGEYEYLMGELQTYSLETLKQYAQHVKEMDSSGLNLVFQIKEMSVKLAGYQSLEDAERRMGGQA